MPDYATLTLTRAIACPPARLFHLICDRDARAQWSGPAEGMEIAIDESDLRPGGREVARCGPVEAPEFVVTAEFHVVEAPQLLVFTEKLDIGGAILSVGLMTMEVAETPDGSTLTVTSQITSLSGPDTAAEVESGWDHALSGLQVMAESTT